MLADWTEASTWSSLVGGVQTDGTEALATSDSSLSPAQGVGPRSFNVTSSLQEWSYAPTANRGWVLVMPTGTAYWEFQSSEFVGGRPPILAVDWTAPTNGTFAFSSATYSVNEGAGTVTIEVKRTDGGVGAVSVNYAATSGTATDGQDFTAVSGTLDFAANEFTKTFTIVINNDTLVENDEIINLTLSNPTGGAVLGTPATAVVTIVDNDGPGILQFSTDNYSVNEDAGTATITVNRVRASDGMVTVDFAATKGSATAGVDFMATTGTLTWANGDATPKTFTITIINDIVLETPERILLTLSNPTGGATLGNPSRAFLTIIDNEPPFTFREGVAGYSGTQDAELRSGEPTTPRGNEQTISVDLSDGGSITQGLLRFDNIFGDGPNQIPFGSTIIQGTLTFQATSGSDGRISIHRMLVNWDESSTWSSFGGDGIQANNVEASSAEDGFLFPATGTGPRNIIVIDALQAWSNGAGNFGWVFLNNSTDGWDFASSENTNIDLRPRLSVLAAPPTPGTLNFSEANYTIDESGTSVTVTVTRSLGTVGTVTVEYAATSGTATAGEDFTAVSGTFTFAPGETSKTFTITITNDTVAEADETITLTLSNPTGGAGLGEVSDATVTILDDDGPGVLQFSAPTFTVNENGGAAVLTVSRTRGSVGTVTVEYAATSGTAVAGSDFTDATGTVTFAPGETSKTITIPIVDDGLDETFHETATFTLRNPTGGATLGSQASTVLTIIDNERSLIIQEGFNGYAGTQDTTLEAANPGTAQGTGGTIVADLEDNGLQVQGLLRFDNLFGTGPNQIPPNATIHAATLTVQVTDESNGLISLHRMLVTWNENSTWNSLDNGVQLVTEAALFPDNQPISLDGVTGPRSFDVTSSLQAWRAGAPNFGWVFLNTTTDGWDIQSSEAANGLQRPRLEVVYTAEPAPTPLQVTSFTGSANGFTVGFNQPFDHSVVNVFGSASDPLGLPDVVVTGPGGAVAGSLVVNPVNTGVNSPFAGVLTFLPTGGPLAPGTYEVTLRSAANGFKNLYGGLLLDGNGDGTAGDNYTNTFTVAAPAAGARVVSLPNFVRGPNQAVNVATGIPLRLSEGQGVTAVSLQIRYDPALLNLTSATALPAGSSVTFNTNTPGVAQVTFTSPTPLAAGAVDFMRLNATVREDAPYGSKHVLDLVNVTINAGAIPAVEDDGLHIVSYLGDTNGSGNYESADAVLVQRYSAGMEAGFAAFRMADPTLIADITQDGQVNADDATAAMQLAAGTPVQGVPPRPATPAAPIPGGADPRLYIPTTLAGAIGETVTVPVLLEVTDPAGASATGVDVALRYDASRFAVSNLRLGGLLAGFAATFNAQTPGELRLVAFAARGPELAFGASGALFLVDFTVLPGAAAGASSINLVAALAGTTTGIFGNDLRPLTLVPAPTDGADDPVDGLFTVTAAEPVSGGDRVSDLSPAPGQDGLGSRSAALALVLDETGERTGQALDGNSAPGQDGLDSGSAALALVLAATGERTSQALGGNLGGGTAADASDEFFRSYGSNGAGVADPVFLPLVLRGVADAERAGDEVTEGSEGGDGSDWLDVHALFGSLGDRG
jgi:hypothetical protein